MLTEDAAPPFALVEEPPPPRWRRNVLVKLFILLVVMALGAPLLAAIVAPAFGAGVWVADKVDERIQEITAGIEVRVPHFPERSKIYAADGTRLATIFLNENREVVRLRNVARVGRKAVLAAEDADFYEHSGIDYDAVVRAFLRNTLAGEIEQGASTISQQLARTAVRGVGSQDTLQRKIREAWVATELEKRYTKREILELYINEVYFGGGAYGIETAALRYFGEHASELTLPQAALLAGTIAAPSRFSPYHGEPRAVRRRRNLVIRRMRQEGWISRERAQVAIAAPVEYRKGPPAVLRQPREPYFVEYVKREILSDKRFGETRQARERLLYQGGLDIHTTIRPDLQEVAHEAGASRLPLESDPENAIASVDPRTGAIVTLAGSTDFNDNEYDLASQGKRQSGSAFKPFTLVAALEAGISPNRVYNGSSGLRIPLPGQDPPFWNVPNAEGGSYGNLTLRSATTNSVNVVFAQLILDVGPAAVVETANRMGIQSELPEVYSLTLGTASVSPLEMASAYGTLANEGVYCKPYAVEQVLDRNGDVLFQRGDGNCEQVVDPDIALTAVDILKTVVCCGTGTAANIGRPQFGKTGTTNDYADAWFVGCVVQLCTSSWVGHLDSQRPMGAVHGVYPVYGGTFPAQIWQAFMSVATDGMQFVDWPAPPPFGPDTGPGRDRERLIFAGGGGNPGGGGSRGDTGGGGGGSPPGGGGGSPPVPPAPPPPKTDPPPKTGGGPKSD